jgi:cell division inhibitor SepF
MALRDTWHKALVYFGLAEDHDYGPEYEEDFEPETGTEEVFESRRERGETGSVRRLPTSRRARRDEIDDIFADDEPIAASRTRTLRPVDNGGSGGDIQVHLVIPRNFNDAQQVADQFKRQVPVILNLQTADHELSKRMIDFCSGLTYALDGGMQRIAEKMFLLTPRNVEVSAEERARLIDKGFFNQS